MGFLPINVDVTGKTCLVVGGGEVGERKVRNLLKADARVRLVSRELTDGLADLVLSGRIEHAGKKYEMGHLDGVSLVFAATSDPGLHEKIQADASEFGIWVNVADRPDLCDFIVPAAVIRGDLTISISTGGKSPALAAKIRKRLEEEFGPEYAGFLDLMGRIREKVLADGGDARENRKLFRRLVESELPKIWRPGREDDIGRILTGILGKDYTLDRLGIKPEETR